MTFRRADLDRLADIMTDAAETEIMPRFRSLGVDGIREKTSALDLVTDADEKAEWRMRDACAKAFPAARFIGEESVERDRSLLQGTDVYRRAQDLLNEIRRRAGEQSRPEGERGYLKRLLDLF